ncbi:MAG: GDP-mannose 4,6-dehydratase [Gemmatimonadota bacterium]|nr:GDP-mannose 4,6-dehydratase [Gemmatimonadota bacterium]
MKLNAGHDQAPVSLITGGAGFIGSHLADLLLERGERVIVVDDLSTGRMANIAHLSGQTGFRFVQGDVREPGLVEGLARECGRIYHLAAVVGVIRVMESRLRVVEENIFGTHAVIRAALEVGARVFVASTSEVYGANLEIPFREDSERVMGSPQIKRWGYATAKAVDEILAYGYAEEHGLEVVVARFFNTIGQRQTGEYGMVVPRFIEQALSGQPISVYGTGEQTRSFCDVRDTVRAIVGLMDNPDALNRPFNIGATREISINALAELVLGRISPERAGRPAEIRRIGYEEAYPPGYAEFPRRVPDISHVGATIGWTPEYSLEETLDWIAEGSSLARSA